MNIYLLPLPSNKITVKGFFLKDKKYNDKEIERKRLKRDGHKVSGPVKQKIGESQTSAGGNFSRQGHLQHPGKAQELKDPDASVNGMVDVGIRNS